MKQKDKKKEKCFNVLVITKYIYNCPLSPVLFVISMDRISRHSLGVEQVSFGSLGIASAVCR